MHRANYEHVPKRLIAAFVEQEKTQTMSKASLMNFIKTGSIVYQMIDGLIETSDKKSSFMIFEAIQEDNIKSKSYLKL